MTAQTYRGTMLGCALALAGRNLIRIFRLPSALIPSLVFPLFSTIAFSGAFYALTRLPGFPTDNILSWNVPFSAMQGAAFAGGFMAFSAIGDLEMGFMDRLLTTPIPRASFILGPSLAGAVRSLMPVALTLMVGVLGGLALPGGLLGLTMLILTCMGIAAVYVPWGLGFAFRIRSQVASGPIQASIMFVFFLAAAQMPLALMTGWIHSVARVNPMTNVIRMGRQGFIGHVTWHNTWPGLVVIAIGTALSWVWAERGLRKLVP